MTALAERLVGRPLRLAEQAVDVFKLDMALNAAKDDLHAAIENEKRRAIRRRARTGHPARLRLTGAMLSPLERLHRLGKREARAELERLGYGLGRSFEASSEIPEIHPMEQALRDGLSGLSVRVESEYTQAQAGGMTADAIARALLRIPGGRAIAADLVSSALFSGMAVTFEENADLVPCWEYSSLLDSGTCAPCASLDGTEYHSLDALFLVLPNFGPHPGCLGGGRCRCRAVPCPPGG